MTAPAPEPRYLGADRPVAVVLHRPDPAAPATGVGLVIVPPFGYEAICAHRALRHLAERAAAAGVAAVRLDLDGTGDSAGDDLDPDRVAAWVGSIARAADHARAAGADRVVLAGVRTGALLAAVAADGRDDVAGLVAIAPVVSGRRWLREMRALQQALGLAAPPPGRAAEGPAGGPAQADTDEAIGFAITAATRDALAAIELDKLGGRPAPAALILDREDLPTADKWAAHLGALGCAVDARRVPGYVEMVLDPHRAEVPDAIVAATVAFCAARPALATPAAPRPAPRADARATLPTPRGAITEEVVAIAPCVRAVVVRPAAGPPPRRALVLLNAGAVRRVGPNRMYVAFARRFAAEGMMVVRADLSGLGDAPPHPGQPERVVFHDHMLDDVAALIAWCRRAGAAKVIVGGLCSGGYYAVRAAVAGHALDGFLAINPGHPESEMYAKSYQAVAESSRYATSVKNLESWKKLVRGDVDVAHVARMVRRRLGSVIRHRLDDVAGRLGALRGLGGELAGLARRGVSTAYVFSEGESVLALFLERLGSSRARLEQKGSLRLRIVPGPDHTFTPRWSHPVLAQEVADALAWGAR